MSMVQKLASWWKALARRSEMEREIEAELHFHIESYAADLMRNGMEREEALRKARMELGTIATQKEECRRSLGLRTWDDLLADLRYAIRQLRRTPAFTVTVLLVLALGIGANAAMFSIIDATLLRWLPYRQASQLISLHVLDAKGHSELASYPDIEEWQNQTHTQIPLAYYDPKQGYLQINGGEQQVSAPQISLNLFGVLGIQPVLGRGFLPEEQTPGKGKVIVLSEPVWQSLFYGDPGIVGKQVKLNGISYTVVGVMPRHFVFPANEKHPQVWVPVEITEAHHKRGFTTPTYQVIARIQNGLTVAGAEARFSEIQQRLAPLYQKIVHEDLGPSRVQATVYRDTLVKNARPALLALMLAVAIIWLIACANVASLMLARSMSRQREIAVRGALGASRWRIVRQLFTESLVLSTMGAAAGLALAQLALHVFDKSLGITLNLPGRLTPDPAVLAALLGLSILSAVLFGLFPAWLAARTPIDHSLRQGSPQAGHSQKRHRLQQAMVVAEIGLTLVLLVASGLLLRTVFELHKVPLGFRTDHVLLVEPKMLGFKYRGADLNRVVFRPLLERVKQMNGVRIASLTTVLPLKKSFESTLTMYLNHSEESSKATKRIDAKLMAASPELQEVLGFRMYKGRFFNQHDTPDSPLVAVVNRAFANLYSPDEDIIDKLRIGTGKHREATIVGIMDDFHQAAIDKPSVPEIDFCATQLTATDNFYESTVQTHMELALRTAQEPAVLIPDLRRVIAEVSPDLQASDIQTMDQVVEDSIGNQLLAAHLLEIFAGAALIVALAGLYGLLAYLVTQRTRELGVRIALGAQRRNIIEMMLMQAGWLLLIGTAIGVGLAYFSSRILASFLYGVKPHDLGTMAVVTTLLLAAGLLAAYIPARRASRVDPMEALRGE
jgi:predicted permease